MRKLKWRAPAVNNCNDAVCWERALWVEMAAKLLSCWFSGTGRLGVCSENKQLLPAEGPCHWPYSSQQQVSHQVPASPPCTHIRMCSSRTHTYVRVRNQRALVHIRGDLELLTENKEGNQTKMQPLRINLTTMLRKIPNLTPRNAGKTWFLSFKAVRSVLQKQK